MDIPPLPIPARKNAARRQILLPDRLPGSFFVVAYNRDYETFTLFVDDADGSSFDLGRFENLGQHLQYFERQSCGEIAERALSQARSFGAAQAWIGTNLVNTIRPPEKKKNLLENMGKDDARNKFTKLPSL